MSFGRSAKYAALRLGAVLSVANFLSFDIQKRHLTGSDTFGTEYGGRSSAAYLDAEPRIPFVMEPGRRLANLVFDDWRDNLAENKVRKTYFSAKEQFMCKKFS